VPLPVWECECGEKYVFGSVKEIEEASGEKIKDLHRPEIDEVKVKCKKCGKKANRVPEVLDCWMESGSMPYGEWHYPFENKEEFKKGFPADFIAEYTGQLRAWFYYLHVLSNALMNGYCFKNVIVTGVIWGSDGKKMSKSLGNYPDPKRVLQQHGGDALRLYLMGSKIMAGEDISVSEEGIKTQVRDVLIPAWNSFRFLNTFARLHDWNSSKLPKKKKHILDKWIESRLWSLVKRFTYYMDRYNIPKAVGLIFEFVNDLSKWYIRRSRDRFRDGDKEALATLYNVLLVFSKITGPIIPFLSESMFKNLTESAVPAGRQDSVHLEDWPEAEAKKIDKNLEEKMVLVRKICELGHAARKEAGIKVRQPLGKLQITCPAGRRASYKLQIGKELTQLIKDELNVKEIVWQVKKVKEPQVELDTKLTPELKAEGEARELVRQIQELRKEKGCRLDEKIIVSLPSWPKKFESYIKKQTLAKKLLKAKKLKISA
jgi:isoleucyl-tRNA synthetase